MDITGLIIGIILAVIVIVLIFWGSGREKARIDAARQQKVEAPAAQGPTATPVAAVPEAVLAAPAVLEVAEAMLDAPELSEVSGAMPAAPEVLEMAVAEPEVPVVEVPAVSAVPEVTAPVEDDLVIIEGIGPKIAGLLKQQGITTFASLAAADMTVLQTLLNENGLRFINPGSWPQQALLAAEGKMDELKALQDKLVGGR